uniref:Eukaryotic translation initiation factor 6 n=1 Tax=Crocodylus porosus TaxID=8502 RepID=A0A7M4EN92_CROPO
MAVRASFEINQEIGCFAKLTNTYCLTAVGGTESCYRSVDGVGQGLGALSSQDSAWDTRLGVEQSYRQLVGGATS